jgi:hypothetical protein
METESIELNDGSKRDFGVIYTVTTLSIKKVKDEETRTVLGERCEAGKTVTVGWYTSLEAAQKCVSNNNGSLDECGYYNHLVIERVVEGLYGLLGDGDKQTEWWYKYDHSADKWVACEKPKIFRQTIGFWM